MGHAGCRLLLHGKTDKRPGVLACRDLFLGPARSYITRRICIRFSGERTDRRSLVCMEGFCKQRRPSTDEGLQPRPDALIPYFLSFLSKVYKTAKHRPDALIPYFLSFLSKLYKTAKHRPDALIPYFLSFLSKLYKTAKHRPDALIPYFLSFLSKLYKTAKHRPDARVVKLHQELCEKSEEWIVDTRTMEDFRKERRLRERVCRYGSRQMNQLQRDLLQIHRLRWTAINNLPPRLREHAMTHDKEIFPVAYRKPADTAPHPPGIKWK
eukprot:g10801.t1